MILDDISQAMLEKSHSVVFPESQDPRILLAVKELQKMGMKSRVFLLTPDEPTLLSEIKKQGLSHHNLEIVEIKPHSSSHHRFAEQYFELRKSKGISLEEAQKEILDPLKWAALMVKQGSAESMVAGSLSATALVLKAAFSIIGIKKEIKAASSFFIMHLKEEKWGEKGLMIFADCAVIPVPNSEQLASIAFEAALNARKFLQVQPRVALLSFSTKGSAQTPETQKVSTALEILKKMAPDLEVDGEMQLDAAIDQSVAALKAPHSKVAGKANVLIFPDLNSGNIGYKLVQRFAGAKAYGPFLQGFQKPVSDLSRGASVEDIVFTTLLTLNQIE